MTTSSSTSSPHRVERRASPRQLARLLRGEIPSLVSSHEGTDQYSQGAPAACGLAALNSVRIVLGKYKGSDPCNETLEWIICEETAEEIIAISVGWTTRQHLEVEDVSELPLFKQYLSLEGFDQKLVNGRNFSETLRTIQKMSESIFEPTAIAAVITRPPEIFAVFYIPTPDARLPGVFAIYDSHPRPTHRALGASFMLFSTLDSTSRYLTLVTHVEGRTISNDSQWRTQSMNQYSFHIFKAKHTTTPIPTGNNMASVYKTNLEILKLDLEMKNADRNVARARLEKRALDLKESLSGTEMNPSSSSQTVLRTRNEQYYTSSNGRPSRDAARSRSRTNSFDSSQRSDPRFSEQYYRRVDRDIRSTSYHLSHEAQPLSSSSQIDPRVSNRRYYTSSPSRLDNNTRPRSRTVSSVQRSDQRPSGQRHEPVKKDLQSTSYFTSSREVRPPPAAILDPWSSHPRSSQRFSQERSREFDRDFQTANRVQQYYNEENSRLGYERAPLNSELWGKAYHEPNRSFNFY